MIYDCAVVGAGPSGITAAVQLKRAGWNVAIIERGDIGGLVRNAHRIENVLGFPDGISGAELANRLARHVRQLRIPVLCGNVRAITRKGSEPFRIQTGNTTVRARTVIVATGTAAAKAQIPGEQTAVRRRLAWYEIADIPPLRTKKRFLIIGGGDAGFDYAIALHESGHESIILMRSGPQCIATLRRRAEALGIPRVERIAPLRLRCNGPAIELHCKERCWRADYALIAIGRKPNLPRMRVGNKKGLYYTGDVLGGRNRQIHIAAGHAMRLALRLIRSGIPSPPHA